MTQITQATSLTVESMIGHRDSKIQKTHRNSYCAFSKNGRYSGTARHWQSIGHIDINSAFNVKALYKNTDCDQYTTS